ncbi:MAG: amidohydrolase family protein [Pseudomonadales bacterium]
MLIRHAGQRQGPDIDVRVRQGKVTAIGKLTPDPDEQVVDAAGKLLLPGLNDHHIHLRAFATSLDSIPCGPDRNPDAGTLADRLRDLDNASSDDWIRGVGYHESVAGDIDRAWLDRVVPRRPLRIQHRSGRLWVINTAGLRRLAAAVQEQGEATALLAEQADGRFFDADARLGRLIGHREPDIERASRILAAYGVTGLCDMTPANSTADLCRFRQWRRDGILRQRVLLAGRHTLTEHCTPSPAPGDDGIAVGAVKFHLHDHDLPALDTLTDAIASAHAAGRAVAVHCVTEVALLYTLAALEDAGTLAGDRIEHASVAPGHLLETLHRLGLTVVTQPNFIRERGDQYRTDMPANEHSWLYRGRAFVEAGVGLAAGSDAPFGDANPWLAIQAAVDRRTLCGHVLTAAETLPPAAALDLFLGDLATPAVPRVLTVGMPADLCLLDGNWPNVARHPGNVRPVRTWVGGVPVHEAGDGLDVITA